MKQRAYWMLAGGGAFWLPFAVTSAIVPDRVVTQNVLSIVGIVILSAAATAPPPITRGHIAFLILICLFPPMTLWLALLNGGALVSVLAVTLGLGFLATARGSGVG